MYGQLYFLGIRLREERRKRRLTLRELAARTGLSAGLLSKIENFRTVPSLPVLLNIAREMRLELSELFAGLEEEKSDQAWLLLRAGGGTRVERESSQGMDYTMLLDSSLDASRLQVMLVSVAPGAKRRAVSGAGAELIYMLDGELDYRVGEDTVRLHAGDMLFFDGEKPHLPVNGSGKTAAMLVCYFLREEKSLRRKRK